MHPIIGLVAPSCCDHSQVEKVISYFGAHGLEVENYITYDPTFNPEWPSQANTAFNRAADIINAIYECKANILWAIDGGFSADQVSMLLDEYAQDPMAYIIKYSGSSFLPEIKNLEICAAKGLLQKTPCKSLPYFVGFGDNTTIEVVLAKYGVPIIYSANASIHKTPNVKEDRILSLVTSHSKLIEIKIDAHHIYNHTAKIEGVVFAASLDKLCDTLGTREQFIPPQNAVLFLESIYDIDTVANYIKHLYRFGILDGIKAIVLGDILEADDPSCIELLHYLSGLCIPIIYAPNFGHIHHDIPIICFGNVKIDNTKITIDGRDKVVRENIARYQHDITEYKPEKLLNAEESYNFYIPGQSLLYQSQGILEKLVLLFKSGKISYKTRINIQLDYMDHDTYKIGSAYHVINDWIKVMECYMAHKFAVYPKIITIV